MWLFRITLAICLTFIIIRLINYREQYLNERQMYVKKGKEYYRKRLGR